MRMKVSLCPVGEVYFSKRAVPYLWLLPAFILMVFTSCKKDLDIKSTNSKIKYFNGGIGDKVNSAAKTNDGGFIYCGYTELSNGSRDGFLMKVDANGVQQWYNTYGGGNNDEFAQVIQTKDGAFLAVGNTNSIGASSTDGNHFSYDYIVKINQSGIKEWEKSFLPNPGEISAAVESDDHFYYLTGYISSTTSSNRSILILKIDASGNFVYGKFFPNLTVLPPYLVPSCWFSYGRHISIAADGSVNISGVMSKSNLIVEVYKQVTFLMNLNNSTGNVNSLIPYYNYVRSENYLGFAGNPNVKVLNLPDGYLIGTYIEGLNDNKVKMELIRTDSSGNVLWEKQYGGLGQAILYDITLGNDGNYLLSGVSTSYSLNFNLPTGFSNLKTMLLKVDPNGNKLWETFHGSEENSLAAKCIQASAKGGWKVAAYSTLNREQQQDKMLWFETDENGNMIKK